MNGYHILQISHLVSTFSSEILIEELIHWRQRPGWMPAVLRCGDDSFRPGYFRIEAWQGMKLTTCSENFKTHRLFLRFTVSLIKCESQRYLFCRQKFWICWKAWAGIRLSPLSSTLTARQKYFWSGNFKAVGCLKHGKTSFWPFKNAWFDWHYLLMGPPGRISFKLQLQEVDWMKLLGELGMYTYILKKKMSTQNLTETAILVLASLELHCPLVFFCFLMVFGQWVQLLVLEFVVHNIRIKAWEVLYKIVL